jgi:hypothetical protein
VDGSKAPGLIAHDIGREDFGHELPGGHSGSELGKPSIEITVGASIQRHLAKTVLAARSINHCGAQKERAYRAGADAARAGKETQRVI